MAWVLAACSTTTDVRSTATLSVLVTTDLSVPKDMDALRLSVMGPGLAPERQSMDLRGQGAQRPFRFTWTGKPPSDRRVRVRVEGAREGRTAVLQDAWVPFAGEERRTVRLHLSYLCLGAKSVAPSVGEMGADSACGGSTTCEAGACVDAERAGTLGPEEGVGGAAVTAPRGSGCWDPVACFRGLPAQLPLRQGDACILPRTLASPETTVLGLLLAEGDVGACDGKGSCWVPLERGAGPGQWALAGDRVTLPPVLCDGVGRGIVVADHCGVVSSWTPRCDGEGKSAPLATPSEARESSGASPRSPEGPEHRPSFDGGSPPFCFEGASPSVPGPAMAAVTGAVQGLTSEGLVLLLNRSLELPLSPGASSFSFPMGRPEGAPYEVSLAASPLGLICHVINPTGWVPEAGRMTSTRVECSPRPALRQSVGGMGQACVLLEDGHVRCWGADSLGQLAGATPETSIPGLEGVEELALATFHTCARMADRTVRCWGNDAENKLSGSSLRRSIPGLSGVVQLRAYHRHTCALLEDETVRCWGYDDYGQLGGSSPERGVPGLSGVVEVAVGSYHTCARLRDSTVRCWGMDDSGEVQGSSPTESIAGLSGVVGIAAAWKLSCAWLVGGTLRCWGSGVGTPQSQPYVTRDIPGVSGVLSVTPTKTAVWIRGTGNSVRCLGSEFNCPRQDFVYPSDVVEVAGGEAFACARTRDHRVVCWGENGRGTLVASHRFPGIAGLSGVVDLQLSPGIGGAVLGDGTVRLWGQGAKTLEDGRVGSVTESVPGLSGVQALSVTDRFVCAVLQDGTVRCSGTHPYSERRLRFSDGPIRGLTGVMAVAASGNRACFVLADTTLRCWGDDPWSQHGAEDLPETIWGLSGVVQVSVGNGFPCVVLLGGDVRCMGDDDVEVMGWGSSATRSLPGLSGAVEVAVGTYFACALLGDGSVRCWGANSQGQTAGSSPSLPLPGLSGVLRLRAGNQHICALLRGGTVRCWGARAADQTGGSSPTSSIPFIEGATGIAAGGAASCAIGCQGRVQCWGDDGMGQSSGRSTYQAMVIPIGP